MDFIAATYGFGFTKNETFENAMPLAVIGEFSELSELFAKNATKRPKAA
jgi:hypothetical protein